MPYTESARCRFVLSSSGERPSPIVLIECFEQGLSALENPSKRVFFTFADDFTKLGTTNSFVEALNKNIHHMSVAACAAGELWLRQPVKTEAAASGILCPWPSIR
jgi:hypothetical protein